MTHGTRRLLERYNFQKPWFALSLICWVAFENVERFSSSGVFLAAFALPLVAWLIVSFVAVQR